MKYKIKHKRMKRSFSAEDVRFLDDYYLVSYLDASTVVARRDSGNKLVQGDKFCELLDVRDRSELKKYIYNECELPLVLRTDIGTAIIDKYFTLTTLLYSVCFLCDEDDSRVIDTLLQIGSDEVLIPDHYIQGEGKVKRIKEIKNKLDCVLDNHKHLVKNTFVPKDASPKITVEKLYNAIGGLSKFSGCSVDVSMDAELICLECFDLVAFKNYILAMLMLARREARSRTASIELASLGQEIAVKVEFDTDSTCNAFDYPEVNHFLNYADRNNVLFDASNNDGHVAIRFCPSRKDWSLLELKAHIEFDWDS